MYGPGESTPETARASRAVGIDDERERWLLTHVLKQRRGVNFFVIEGGSCPLCSRLVSRHRMILRPSLGIDRSPLKYGIWPTVQEKFPLLFTDSELQCRYRFSGSWGRDIPPLARYTRRGLLQAPAYLAYTSTVSVRT